MRAVEERYMNEVEFKVLVDMMVKMILDYQYTPSEMREAAMFSCVRAEMIRPPESIVALRSTSNNIKRDVIFAAGNKWYDSTSCNGSVEGFVAGALWMQKQTPVL